MVPQGSKWRLVSTLKNKPADRCRNCPRPGSKLSWLSFDAANWRSFVGISSFCGCGTCQSNPGNVSPDDPVGSHVSQSQKADKWGAQPALLAGEQGAQPPGAEGDPYSR